MRGGEDVSRDGTTAPATLGDIEEIQRQSAAENEASPDTGTEQ